MSLVKAMQAAGQIPGQTESRALKKRYSEVLMLYQPLSDLDEASIVGLVDAESGSSLTEQELVERTVAQLAARNPQLLM